MVDKQDYLAKIHATVSRLHHCEAVWRETVPVHEVFHDQTVWQGDVEVFDLNGHPQARRAYAWSLREAQDKQGERIVAVLEIPPVTSAVTAVRASIVEAGNRRKKRDRTR